MPSRSHRFHLLIGGIALGLIASDAFFGLARKRRSTAAPALVQPAATPPKSVALASASASLAVEHPLEHVSATQPQVSLVDQLKAIDADYAALVRPILEQSAPVIAPDDRARLTFLDQEKLADLRKVLSAEELDVYQNQTDPAAAPQRR